MAHATGWFRAMAIVLIILGIASIVEPMVAGLAVTALVGWALILGGLAHLIQAFEGVGFGHAIWQVGVGALYVMGGGYFLTNPLLGLGTLTLLLAGILLVEAVLRIIAYSRLRGLVGSSWLLANGIVTILLGCMIWTQWPSSSVWAIGTLVGVNLLMAGIARLMLGTVVGRVAPRGA
jgi:uncharacterized membrane protein HdeD (DUF308 family)